MRWLPWKRRAPAWHAWADGDITRAGELAADLAGDEGVYLRLLVAAVNGRYEEAVAAHETLSPKYRRRHEVNQILSDIRQHMDPPSVSLAETSVIGFAEHPLTSYFPAFSVEVNGSPLLAHVDTGAPFLVMNPDRARKLGIDLRSAGSGYHWTEKTALSRGLARSLRIGGALLENVPVHGFSTLTGEQDFVIFGTNVLERFLATLDYSKRRLILSPRGDARREEHFRLLSGGMRVEVPFYMWGDHYLWARGGVGVRQDLNFFVDSGLVLLQPNGQDGLKQAAFSARARDLTGWGVPISETRKKFFDSPLPLALGGVVEEGLMFHVEDRPRWSSFGGVRIDGLVCHGFLSKRTWTIDFDRRRFVFSG